MDLNKKKKHQHEVFFFVNLAVRVHSYLPWQPRLYLLPATPTRSPTSPFTQHTTWQYKYGRGSPRLRQPEPALRSVSRPPPIRSRVVTRDVRFTAAGGCSVWFIPVCSCLLRAAGDLTRTHARTHAPRGASERVRAQAVYDRRVLSEHSRARTHAHRCGWRPEAEQCWGGRKQKFSRVDRRHELVQRQTN